MNNPEYAMRVIMLGEKMQWQDFKLPLIYTHNLNYVVGYVNTNCDFSGQVFKFFDARCEFVDIKCNHFALIEY